MASDTNLVSSWVRQIEVHPVARTLDFVVGVVKPSSDQFGGRAITVLEFLQGEYFTSNHQFTVTKQLVSSAPKS